MFCPCSGVTQFPWLFFFFFNHRGHTPAGRAVLETYLSYVPPLPALVLSQLSTGGEVYHFPTERPLLSENIIQWLQRIEDHQEQAAGELTVADV